MGKDRGRREAEQRERQREAEARERQRIADERMVEAARPSPLQQRLEADDLAFLDAVDGTSGPLDVTKLPGMAPYAAQFAADSAEEQQGEERMGEGLVTMGSYGGDPGLASLVRQNRADRRRQNAGVNLARNFAARNAEVRGSVLPLISLSQQNRLGLASLASGNANNAYGRSDNAFNQYLQIRQQPGFFGTMGQAFAGSFGNTLGRALGGGGFNYGGG